MSKKVETIIRNAGLRQTKTRVTILKQILKEEGPFSLASLRERAALAAVDEATIFRNLLRFEDVGIITFAAESKGQRFYEKPNRNLDPHAHFTCNLCEQIICLPEELETKVPQSSRWSEALATARIEIRGSCPDCLEA